MEWTKELLIGTCIKCTSKKQGQKIKEFYESFGVKNTLGWKFSGIGHCYGTREGEVISYHMDGSALKVINPFFKHRRKFPRKMMVSNEKKRWLERIVVGTVIWNGSKHYVSDNPMYGLLPAWKYAKEID